MFTLLMGSPKTFASDERGSVAVLFGMMSLALMFLAGVAIDTARVMDVRTRLADAADAAALTAGKALLDGSMSASEIEDLAVAYFEQNTKVIAGYSHIEKPVVAVNVDTGAVNVDVKAEVDMTLGRLAGLTKMELPVSSAAVFQQKDIEIAMALDITGSMNDTPASGGKRKIDSLKEAFATFAERIVPEQPNPNQRVRMALAPYSSGINLGSFAAGVSQNRSKDKCVTERKGGQLDDDAAQPFNVAADGIDDIDNSDGSTPKKAYACPKAVVEPLSDDRQQLIDTVNAFTTGGWTSGHLGVQWAWNLVSDKWSWGGNSTPDSLSLVSEGKLIKAVVLMTDGSFNTAYHKASIGNGKWSKAQAVELCKQMRGSENKDIVVFAVAFDAPADAQETLKDCATPGDGYYVNAANGAELEAAFKKFADKLTELRLSK